ncbi:6,7-dimethyl-8-ribityllumazine synthase [Notoacmeibacter marinus]|uniref:6,7-dimethyl-8-ribityllumazine synthase n=1 Tax=Notoacmeibacter marinus TaxID=1876515 RepID=UPI000DF3B971|nr:6,7-dimethyl-8-ribityllumazine synthase [Notoacmeibacter marinus]
MNQMTHPEKGNRRVAIIRARWHADIVDQAVESCQSDLEAEGYDVDVFDVPGALEIPLTAQKLAKTGRYDGVVAIAFIVNGGIYHNNYVSTSVSDAMMRVSLDTDTPVFSVALTPHSYQEVEPLNDFFVRHFVKKGHEAASAVKQTLDLYTRIEAGETAKV